MAVTLADVRDRLQLPVSVTDETLEYHLLLVEQEVAEYVPLVTGVAQPRRDRAILDLIQLSVGPTTETVVTSGGVTITRPQNVNRRRNQILARLIDPRLVSGPAATTPTTSVPTTPLGPSHRPHPGTHNRYIGWSDDTTIEIADFSGASVFTTDSLTTPVRVANGYLWFATTDAAGYPDSLTVGATPFNQIAFYMEQAGRVTVSGVDFVVGVNHNLLNGPANSGLSISLGYQ